VHKEEKYTYKVTARIIIVFIATAILLTACAPASPEPTETALASATQAATTAPTSTAAPHVPPTPVILAGTINAGTVSCRVGPGGAYLVRVTLFVGDSLQVLGFMAHNANWLLVQTASDLRCWASADFVALDGDASALAAISDPHIVLPISNYYGPPSSVRTEREGNLVTVRWGPLEMRSEDRPEGSLYLVEAWVCQNGEFVFRAYGATERKAEINDERGDCDQRSHARLVAVERRGYTVPREIPWP
jgi:uncharacterized protein YraI